jgi:Dimerisation domain
MTTSTPVDVPYERAPGLCAEFGGIPPGPTLHRLLEHFRLAWAINSAVELGLADAVGDEPRSAADIAATVGADATRVYRLLRALACHDIFTEASPGRFALTPLAACLRRDSREYGWAAVRWFFVAAYGAVLPGAHQRSADRARTRHLLRRVAERSGARGGL